MAIRKQTNGKYLVELYPQGRNGKRVRKPLQRKLRPNALNYLILMKQNKSRGYPLKTIIAA